MKTKNILKTFGNDHTAAEIENLIEQLKKKQHWMMKNNMLIAFNKSLSDYLKDLANRQIRNEFLASLPLHFLCKLENMFVSNWQVLSFN